MDGFLNSIVVAHVISSAFMLGVIWFVQIVHYPLFAQIGSAEFLLYEEQHLRRTGFIVGPMMFVEAVSAALLFSTSLPTSLLTVNAFCLCAIWFSTICLQMPAHEKLASSFDAQRHQFLVRSNWVRTFFWSLRAIVIALILFKLL